MTLWRMHLLPKGEDPEKAFLYCLDYNVACIGWPVSREPKTPDEYEQLARAEYAKPKDPDPSSAIALVKDVKYKDLIWIRSPNKIYYLGEVTGDWIYKASSGLDFANQRPCAWKRIGTIDEAPGVIKLLLEEIKNAFTPKALQRISSSKEIIEFSEWLYAIK